MKHLLILILLVGCGTSTTIYMAPPDYNFSGTWNGTLTGATVATNFTIVGIQVGNDISGTLNNDAGFVFDVVGIAWENNISITCEDISNPAYYVVCDGTCDGIYASGSWYDSIGQNGSWEAWIQ